MVDLVFGPHELWRFPELIKRVMDSHKRVFAADKNDGAVAEGIPVNRTDGVKGVAFHHVRLQQFLHVLHGAP